MLTDEAETKRGQNLGWVESRRSVQIQDTGFRSRARKKNIQDVELGEAPRRGQDNQPFSEMKHK